MVRKCEWLIRIQETIRFQSHPQLQSSEYGDSSMNVTMYLLTYLTPSGFLLQIKIPPVPVTVPGAFVRTRFHPNSATHYVLPQNADIGCNQLCALP